jgi:hypothetical protein
VRLQVHLKPLRSTVRFPAALVRARKLLPV